MDLADVFGFRQESWLYTTALKSHMIWMLTGFTSLKMIMKRLLITCLMTLAYPSPAPMQLEKKFAMVNSSFDIN